MAMSFFITNCRNLHPGAWAATTIISILIGATKNQAVSWNCTRPSYTLPRYSPHLLTGSPLYQKED